MEIYENLDLYADSFENLQVVNNNYEKKNIRKTCLIFYLK